MGKRKRPNRGNGGSGNNSSTAPAPAPISNKRTFEVSSTSTSPAPVIVTAPNTAVRVASPDLLLVKNEQLPIDTIADLILDDIGGQEIINISRSDLINGVNSSYQLISDSLDLAQQYNSTNLIPMPGQTNFYFNSQPIDIAAKIPSTALGTSDDFVIKAIETNVNGTIVSKDRYIQIIDVVGDGTHALYTTIEDHGLKVGDVVEVVGIEPTGYNSSLPDTVTAVPHSNVFELAKTAKGQYVSSIRTVYFETDTGDLIVEVENMQSNESVEIEIVNSVSVFDDTMY